MPDTVRSGKHRAAWLALPLAACLAGVSHARADDCAPEPQGEGRVASVVDARTLRLDDGRVVRLEALAALRPPVAERAAQLLGSLAIGRNVSLHADNDAPDRYGRQRAWVFAEGDTRPLQVALAEGGGAVRDLVRPDGCVALLAAAEDSARASRRGLWSTSQFVKKAESVDDISSEIGHFTVVEGRVRSVRGSGATTYLNFGRRWTEGFAVIVPKAAALAFETAGSPVKGFEGKTVQVRGYVVRRGGPRIEALRPDQIEVVGGGAATTGTRD